MLQCNLWSHNPFSVLFCVFFFRCLVSYGPSNLLRRPPTLSLWPLSICGTFLVVGLPVALRAGASTLLGWMLSYPVSRVGGGYNRASLPFLVAWTRPFAIGSWGELLSPPDSDHSIHAETGCYHR